jgi:hypothetical protein
MVLSGSWSAGSGLGAALVPCMLAAAGVGDVLLVVAFSGVIALALACDIRVGLDALRSSRNPLRPVLYGAGCYCAGASFAIGLGWSAGQLPWLWAVAGSIAGVVAAVMTAMYAVRTR